MATYTLNLGFNWNSPLIGSSWSRWGVSGSYCFLQYALANDQGAPAWFNFETGDAISVKVWDLSASPNKLSLDLAMALNSLDAPAQTYNPSDYMSMETSVAGTLTAQYNLQPYLELTTLYDKEQSPLGSPWGDCSSCYPANGSITFTGPIHCKLSFCLRARLIDRPVTQTFISDPEVIVGSGRQ